MLNLFMILLCGVLLVLVLVLLIMLFMTQRASLRLLMEGQKLATTNLNQQLQSLMQENQSLRNQLRAADVPTLVGLNHATLPSDAVASNDFSPPEMDLGEAIFNEELMAKQGYKLGDLGDDLESSGWARPVIRIDDGEPVAFDTT